MSGPAAVSAFDRPGAWTTSNCFCGAYMLQLLRIRAKISAESFDSVGRRRRICTGKLSLVDSAFGRKGTTVRAFCLQSRRISYAISHRLVSGSVKSSARLCLRSNRWGPGLRANEFKNAFALMRSCTTCTDQTIFAYIRLVACETEVYEILYQRQRRGAWEREPRDARTRVMAACLLSDLLQVEIVRSSKRASLDEQEDMVSIYIGCYCLQPRTHLVSIVPVRDR